MKNRSFALLLLLVVVVLTSCAARTTNLRTYAEILKALESAGLAVTERPDSGPLGKALMATEYHMVDVEHAKVHVCIIPEDVKVTTADGYSFTARQAGSETGTGIHIDWVDKPQVFQKDNLVVVFSTSDPNLADRILSALKQL